MITFSKEDQEYLFELFVNNPKQFLQFHYMRNQVYSKNLPDKQQERLKNISRTVSTDRMLIFDKDPEL